MYTETWRRETRGACCQRAGLGLGCSRLCLRHARFHESLLVLARGGQLQLEALDLCGNQILRRVRAESLRRLRAIDATRIPRSFFNVVPTRYDVTRRPFSAFQTLHHVHSVIYPLDTAPEARFAYDISPMAVVVERRLHGW